MTVYQYAAIEQKRGKSKTYGLEVTEKKKSEKHVVLIVPNVTDVKSTAKRLARLFTKEQLHPIHVKDVLEDMNEDKL